MKKNILLFILLTLCLNSYSFDEGVFLSKNYINQKYTIRNSGDEKTVDYSSVSIGYNLRNYNIDYICVDGSMPFFIIKKEIRNNIMQIEGFYLESDFQNNIEEFINAQHTNYNYYITIIDNDEIILNDFIYQKETHFYRISGPAKIPVKNAKINDNRVRLRVKPNLTCDTWAFLDKDLPVKIKDKSSEPFEIDGEKWYWYKVDNSNYPDGWVYGKYLDIEK